MICAAVTLLAKLRKWRVLMTFLQARVHDAFAALAWGDRKTRRVAVNAVIPVPQGGRNPMGG
jgi:hypothetical protein